MNFLASLANRFRITIRELLLLTALVAAVIALILNNSQSQLSGFVPQLETYNSVKGISASLGVKMECRSSGEDGSYGGKAHQVHCELLLNQPSLELRGQVLKKLQEEAKQSLEDHNCRITGEGTSFTGSNTNKQLTAFNYSYDNFGHRGIYRVETYPAGDGSWYLSVDAGEW